MSPFTSACIDIHFSGSIRSTIRRRRVCGFWISGFAFLKISPSVSVRLPRCSRVWRYWTSSASPSLPSKVAQS